MSVFDRIFPPAAGHPRAPVTPAPGGGSPAAPRWSSAVAADPATAPMPPLGPGGGAAVAPADLLERRTKLAEQLATLQWDLGGLTYEMAVRDHFRLEVLVRAAARLQEVDAELGEVERVLRLEDAGAAGECPTCSALHARGALFCWQCGTQLMQTAPAAPSATALTNGHSA